MRQFLKFSNRALSRIFKELISIMKRHVFSLALMTAVVTAHAAELTIVNPGFEALTLMDGSFVANIPGWTHSGDSGTFNPSTLAYPGGVAFEGNNVAYSASGGPWISQLLTSAVEANTIYQLSLYVGRRIDIPLPGYLVELRAGGQLLASDNGGLTPAAGTFERSMITFTSGPTDSVIGSALEIRFRSLGPQANFDGVSLVASPIPEVSTMLTSIAGLLALAVIRRRKA